VKKTWQDYGREWLDTLVVAISVAMAFRAYFYEPFNIPTGSMQPTLYGNHSEVATPDDKSVWDLPVLSLVKFLATGRTYKEFRAPYSGELNVLNRGDGCVDVFVSNSMHVPKPGGILRFVGSLLCENEMDNWTGVSRLPTDAMRTVRASGMSPSGRPSVTKGDVIWNGCVTKGDFIFVNRWHWNFFKPARGEVMVFSTTGIDDLPQGTHYIKRMTALPNETIEIRKPDVFIDGTRIAPLKPMVGKRGEVTPSPNPGEMKGPFKLGADEFFACGDNSDNSKDSRYWGAVPRKNLRGLASIVFWPIVNPRWGNIR